MKPIAQLAPRQRRLIQESFESAQSYSTALTKLFYGRLFELAPGTRPLFKHGIEEQSRKLFQMLQVVVSALDRFDHVRSLLVEMGRRHSSYGARPEHYTAVRQALLWALSRMLEAQFDTETRMAWDALLVAVGEAMMEGAGSHESPTVQCERI